LGKRIAEIGTIIPIEINGLHRTQAWIRSGRADAHTHDFNLRGAGIPRGLDRIADSGEKSVNV
jgi:hypothetical protein